MADADTSFARVDDNLTYNDMIDMPLWVAPSEQNIPYADYNSTPCEMYDSTDCRLHWYKMKGLKGESFMTQAECEKAVKKIERQNGCPEK